MTAKSAEAIARKREYARAYYATHRAYFQAYHSEPSRRARWNAERRTPEYRARAMQWPSQGIRRAGTPPPKHTPQLDVDGMTEQAMALVGIATVPDATYDAGWRDLVQEAVLAMLEGRDPLEAVKAMRSQIRAAQLLVRDPVVMEGLAG